MEIFWGFKIVKIYMFIRKLIFLFDIFIVLIYERRICFGVYVFVL